MGTSPLLMSLKGNALWSPQPQRSGLVEYMSGWVAWLVLSNIQSWLHLHAGHLSYLLHMAGVFPHFVKLMKPKEG